MITSATRFNAVQVSYDVNALGQTNLVVREIDNTIHQWVFGPQYALITGTSLTNLEALREIHASSVGLQNDGDVPIAVEVIGNFDPDYAETLEEHEALGHYNPLKAGSYEAWKNNLHGSFGATLKHTTVSVDADTGRFDLSSSAGSIPVKRIPGGGTLAQALEDWAVYYSGPRANWRLVPRGGGTFVAATAVQDDKRILGLLAWFESVRISGLAVPLTVEHLNEVHGALTGRNFAFDQIAGDTSSAVTITLTSVGYGPTLLSISMQHFSGATLSPPALTLLMDAISASITTDAADEEPPRGSTSVRQRMERAEFADGQFTSERGHPTWKGNDGRKRTMGGSYGEEISWGNLGEQSETVGGVTTEWRDVPLLYGLRSIHDGGGVDNITRIPHPEDIVPNQGEILDLEIHKTGTDGSNLVQNHDGSEDIIKLLPNEHAIFRVVWRDDGGQAIRSIGHVDRVYELAGTPSSYENARFNSVNYFADGSTYYRPVPLAGGSNISVDKHHTEIFERAGADTFTDGAALSNLYLPQSVKVLRAGSTRIELDLSIRSAAGGGGTLPNGHGIQLLRNGALVQPAIVYREMGINENRTWFMVTELDVAEDDIITPLFHYSSGTSMSMGGVEIAFYRLRLDHEHQINVETT